MRSGARDECGVFGVYARDEDAATLCYFGLYALQHRGQESAGIAVSDGEHIVVTREMGLVNQVFSPARLVALSGHLGIGHVRYSTTGASTWDNAQPAFKVTASGGSLALAHNGNLVNTAALTETIEITDASGRGCSDSELLASLLARRASETALEDALADTCSQVSGAFSVTCMDSQALYAARDPHGFRPLVLGRLPRGGYVVASETAALDIVGAHLLREVEPGEIVVVDSTGLRSRRFSAATPRFCVFEYVYVARPDHRTAETSVYAARRRMGGLLAAEAPVDADLVIPVPDSGTAAAAGYSEASGIPYAEGLVKNRYVGRTFIQPSQSLRQLGIRLKLSPLRDILEGRRIVVVDDSIVRGNTSRQLVAMLRASGAAEVHLRITSPPVRHPCFYGIDMATRAELVGAGLSVEQIRDFTGADSLAYLSLEALVAATRRERTALCRACFDGDYPIPVAAQARGGETVLQPRAP
jgi:amidophosphoribosyltransferase